MLLPFNIREVCLCTKLMEKQFNLKEALKKLEEISKWFETQKEIDIEEGINKVKEAAGLIKASKDRLKAVENQFEEIKKEIIENEDISKS
ncbi:exodeoxyribonuclease VII small subunit [bacterium (Candidatus Gribaldobacteria) CG_4_8_14_3_um_filter_42_11]|uniref:Exodeoxyribonuclease VII small subunit n=2 Tax=Candidatus Gribaldobacteria TaxID=2798536 RepID=A0A2M7IYZ3_9BACT|nr:MAG: exodeoxyribonuclease VII small subunit [bacterium (Candidatus Gribaldobacteria) CG02_land_8_20_14_3_00_41_15]PIX03379.1 MAG: exodeoxyribonuclease VII small subunit [bacterium (Candidatus Gribaldobacteria) CG_4_8_14_3_um_filter_42_11]